MPPRKRVSRPHPERKPANRLVTKARQQEWDEERDTVPAAPKATTRPKAPQRLMPAPRAARQERVPESPDLIATLTHRKKTVPPIKP